MMLLCSIHVVCEWGRPGKEAIAESSRSWGGGQDEVVRPALAFMLRLYSHS